MSEENIVKTDEQAEESVNETVKESAASGDYVEEDDGQMAMNLDKDFGPDPDSLDENRKYTLVERLLSWILCMLGILVVIGVCGLFMCSNISDKLDSVCKTIRESKPSCEGRMPDTQLVPSIGNNQSSIDEDVIADKVIERLIREGYLGTGYYSYNGDDPSDQYYYEGPSDPHYDNDNNYSNDADVEYSDQQDAVDQPVWDDNQVHLGVMLVPDQYYLNESSGGYTGARVVSVFSGSNAENAGILPDDLIINVDGKPVSSAEDIKSILSQHWYGDEIVLHVYRPSVDQLMNIRLVLNDTEGVG